jgi:hypothetical protein
MTVIIENNKCRNSGKDGINISGFSDGDFVIRNNDVSDAGRNGIGIYPAAPLMVQLGLPDDTDPRDLAELLQRLQGLPPTEREHTAESSGLLQLWATRGLNTASLAANLVTIAGGGSLSSLIAILLKAATS